MHKNPVRGGGKTLVNTGFAAHCTTRKSTRSSRAIRAALAILSAALLFVCGVFGGLSWMPLVGGMLTPLTAHAAEVTIIIDAKGLSCLSVDETGDFTNLGRLSIDNNGSIEFRDSNGNQIGSTVQVAPGTSEIILQLEIDVAINEIDLSYPVSITIKGTGSLTVNNSFINASNLTINNNGGLIINSSTASNNGKINNNTALTINKGIIFTNNGTMKNNNGGNITNDGTLTNINGYTVTNSGTMTNNGTVTNSGKMINDTYGTFTNNGIMSSSGNSSTFTNGGTMTNSGTMTNGPASKVTNNGTIENNKNITNYGGMTNKGTVNNQDSATLLNEGTFTNEDTINNAGTLTNNGTFNNNKGTINVTGNGVINGNNAITGGIINYPPQPPAPAPAASASPCASGHTSYTWQTVTSADEHNDGEMVFACAGCGHVLYRVRVSAYGPFQKVTAEKIRNAAQGATVEITTSRWYSFHRSVMEALAARPDVTLTISFLSEGYKGDRLILTIPAGTDTISLLNEDSYAGFFYISWKLGTLRPAN